MPFAVPRNLQFRQVWGQRGHRVSESEQANKTLLPPSASRHKSHVWIAITKLVSDVIKGLKSRRAIDLETFENGTQAGRHLTGKWLAQSSASVVEGLGLWLRQINIINYSRVIRFQFVSRRCTQLADWTALAYPIPEARPAETLDESPNRLETFGESDIMAIKFETPTASVVIA